MSNRFFEGQKIERLVFQNQEVIIVGSATLDRVVKSITVTMENGQMAPVPWFLVEYSNGEVQKWNAALVEGVTLA